MEMHHYHSKLVHIQGNTLIYVKVNNNNKSKTIELEVCKYDVISEKETIVAKEK